MEEEIRKAFKRLFTRGVPFILGCSLIAFFSASWFGLESPALFGLLFGLLFSLVVFSEFAKGYKLVVSIDIEKENSL